MRKPKGYVNLQYEGNAVHVDGRPEHSDDVFPILDAHEEMADRFPAPSSILSVGCRIGYELEALQKYYPKAAIVGVDIVPEFVQCCQERGVSALEADMHKLPMARGLFDWTFCIGTLEHAYNAKKVAKELLRVTRKALYVTADMEEESAKRVPTLDGKVLTTSHCTFIQDPKEWKTMFDAHLVWEHTEGRTLHMIWEKA